MGSRTPSFKRSDIPLADRLLMQKYKTIAEHREDAARIAQLIACVALNDTEGLGYIRLNRFAKRCQELSEEYYHSGDPEVQEEHLYTRLRQLGFIVENGHIYAIEDENGKAVTKKQYLKANFPEGKEEKGKGK